MNVRDLAWRIAIRHELPVRRARAGFTWLLGRMAVALGALPGTSWRFGPPRRTAVDSFEWAGERGLPCHEVSPGGVAHRRVDDFGQALPIEFVLGQEWPIRRDFVVELDRARVWGRDAVPITSDDTVLADMGVVGIQKPEALPIKRRLWLGRPEHLAGVTTTLVGPFPQSYHHWILDILPRLSLVADAGLRVDHVLVPPMQAFHRETLERAGVDANTLVVHDPASYRSLERLVLPSFPGQYGQAPPRSCGFARELFAGELAASGPASRRLYVGRSGADRRRIRNEADVIAALEPLGFEAVSMGGLTVGEQAALLASAEVVVGAHGGALTNLVFCQPGTAVVELFGPRYTPWCYWAIAETIGLRYLPLFQEHDQGYNGVQWTDYTVALDRLTAALRHLGVV